MPDKYYSKEEIGERIRKRLNPPQVGQGNTALARLKEIARRKGKRV